MRIGTKWRLSSSYYICRIGFLQLMFGSFFSIVQKNLFCSFLKLSIISHLFRFFKSLLRKIVISVKIFFYIFQNIFENPSRSSIIRFFSNDTIVNKQCADLYPEHFGVEILQFTIFHKGKTTRFYCSMVLPVPQAFN